MRKIIGLFILLFVSSVAFGQTSSTDQPEKNGFEKMIFEVKLNKANYLPFEPLFVTFKVSNPTSSAIAVEKPDFLLHSKLKVITPKGKTIEVNSLSTTTGGGVNLPGPKPELQQSQIYEEESVPLIDPNIIAKPGIYRLQFFLNGLESNIVEMEILNPQGINKAAFDFLNDHGKDIWFGRILEEKNGSDLLKAFVRQYSESDYAVYAINSLGKYYLFFEKDLNKAEAEFEKIKNSQNLTIALNANKGLAEIAQKKVDLEQTQTQVNKPQ